MHVQTNIKFKAEKYRYLIFPVYKVLKIFANLVLRDEIHRHDRGFLSFQVVVRFVVRINIIVTTRPSAGRHYVHISYTEFCPIETISEERGHRYLFTSL